MFVRSKRRFKDGKEHRYWSVVENRRRRDGRVVQRQVLYLGEINDSQRTAWCRSIEVLRDASGPTQMALFPADREAPDLACEVVRVNVGDVRLHRPRQWGACWLALTLWDRLEPLGRAQRLGDLLGSPGDPLQRHAVSLPGQAGGGHSSRFCGSAGRRCSRRASMSCSTL